MIVQDVPREARLTTSAGGVSRRIYAVDVGSTRNGERGQPPNFAWARVDPQMPEGLVGSFDIELLCDRLVADLKARRSVALGLEAPLFIPVPTAASKLSRGRKNEGSRSFAAPAGLAVASLGLHQAAWILRRVSECCSNSVSFQVAPTAWPPNADAMVLFCWEAFVSESAHSPSHITDAATAVMDFLAHESDLASANAVTAEHPLSLIAAAALWSGLAVGPEMLREPTVVLRPAVAFRGVVPPA